MITSPLTPHLQKKPVNEAEMVDAFETRLGGRKEVTTAVEAVIELI